MESAAGEFDGYKDVTVPPRIIKATLVKGIRKKYGKKKADDVILPFLLKVLQDYLKHGLEAAGAGYHSAKVLWDRVAGQEMTWEQKVDLYMQLSVFSPTECKATSTAD